MAALLVIACSETPVSPVADLASEHLAASATSTPTVTPAGPTIQVGESLTLSVSGGSGRKSTATWTSSDVAIASVTPLGLVTGVSQGIVLITATSLRGPASTQVRVAAPPPPPSVDAVNVTPGTAAVYAGATVQLQATAVAADGAPVSDARHTWASTAVTVAAVSPSGLVTGVAAGTATITATAANGVFGQATVTVADPPVVPPPSTVRGIWIGTAEVKALPMAGPAWDNVKAAADSDCGVPDLANQDQDNNVCIMAKALVYVRTGSTAYRDGVLAALRSIVNSGTYTGRALALGRELAAYVISADLIGLSAVDPALDTQFRARLRTLLTTPTIDGPANLIECHNKRPNNWGTHCGASRIAVAAYLNDRAELDRAAKVFFGWLGNRASYAGFSYGELSWQCDAAAPVGINPAGCLKSGHPIDGVLPDDQRRAGTFTWPPPPENYVYEALQGALAQAVLLQRGGYDVWNASSRALLRAFQWLNTQANFPAQGDDGWQPHLVNKVYGTSFPAPLPARAGKNVGWTDWTHQ